MKRPGLAVLALALAAASTAAMAAAGDTWYGTNRHDDVVITAPVEVTRVYTEPALGDRIIYEERIAAPVIERPVIVERDYVVHEPVYRVVPREAFYDPLNPQTGPAIGLGLFNRDGPNDFGA